MLALWLLFLLAIYSYAVVWELGFCGFWMSFFCPLWWKWLLFCPLSNEQQAASLPSVRAHTQWREVMTQEFFVGGFSTLLDPPYKAKQSPDELWTFTVLESIAIVLLFYRLEGWGMEKLSDLPAVPLLVVELDLEVGTLYSSSSAFPGNPLIQTNLSQ